MPKRCDTGDLLLGPDSPAPIEVAFHNRGKRIALLPQYAQAATVLNLAVLLQLLHELLQASTFACTTTNCLSRVPTRPHLQQHLHEDSKLHLLEGDEASMVSHALFLERLLLFTVNDNTTQSLAGLLECLARDSIERSDTICQTLVHTLLDSNAELKRRLFSVLEALFLIEDEVAATRILHALTTLLDTLKQCRERLVPSATKRCLALLVGVLQRVKACAAVARAHPDLWSWCVDWLRAHQHHQQRRRFGDGGGNVKASRLIEFLEALRDGAALNAFDALPEQPAQSWSRPMNLELYMFVDALDSVQKWCEAVVVDIDAALVKLHYLGWSERWDEWLSGTSARLAPHGSRTSRNDVMKHWYAAAAGTAPVMHCSTLISISCAATRCRTYSRSGRSTALSTMIRTSRPTRRPSKWTRFVPVLVPLTSMTMTMCSTGFVVERDMFYAVITGEFTSKLLKLGSAATIQ